MGFSQDVFKFRDKALLAANVSVNRIVEELFTSIVVLSPSPVNKGPFARGYLVNQYYPAIGANNFSTSLSLSTSDYGIESLSRIKAIIAQNLWLGKDAVVTLTNNTEEAYRAEIIGWPAGGGSNGWRWSGKARPYKMVATSINNIIGKYK